MVFLCECGRELDDLYTAADGTLMVDCPVHGVHAWGADPMPVVN